MPFPRFAFVTLIAFTVLALAVEEGQDINASSVPTGLTVIAKGDQREPWYPAPTMPRAPKGCTERCAAKGDHDDSAPTATVPITPSSCFTVRVAIINRAAIRADTITPTHNSGGLK